MSDSQTRRLNDLDCIEKLYFVLSGLSILVTISLSIFKMTTISKSDSDFTFSIVLIRNAIFCTFYVVHGLLKERAYEIVIFMIAIFGILLYSITLQENKVGSWIFIIVAPAEPAYVIFKMSTQEAGTAQGDLVGATIAAGVLALVTRSVLMVLLYFVYRNYGKGLKEKAEW
ncbi:uncharacterized protein LOC130010690 [Patella vulgata]|uniref:uncharacterized protein LOC130010690 n=1 Tax=Patella vulgata TaxID=6465 RepID=UPI0024A8F6AF|nr:uncharacterized protein LOC130010690 [Patella vulgata]